MPNQKSEVYDFEEFNKKAKEEFNKIVLSIIEEESYVTEFSTLMEVACFIRMLVNKPVM